MRIASYNQQVAKNVQAGLKGPAATYSGTGPVPTTFSGSTPTGASGTNTSGAKVAQSNLFGLDLWEILALVGVVAVIIVVFAMRKK